MRVFVYGTLMRGEVNHNQLAGQRYLGPAQTGAGWVLYQLDGYPGAVREDGAGAVVGELWEVDAAALQRLDAFEGVGEGLYRRETVKVTLGAYAVEAEVYVYARSTAGCVRLGDDWRGHGVS
ncbi:gamma-glutamylcyclotransferase [Nibricoccus sp. IMCC34717]|uniref:gamma-glutamylcyclotransferase family protein n=1 Tax=Nibricoccus sp. IMCC34717 TaxID=3034021 RepID=UPI00384D5BF3